MALKRWRWVWAPVLAALLVAIAVLPPRVPTGEGTLFGVLSVGSADAHYGNWTRRGQHADDIQAARLTQRARLGRTTLADSIMAMANGPRALRSVDGLVTLVYEAPLTADSARAWLGAASRELALYPKGPTPGTRLVVALLSSPTREGPGNQGVRYEGVQALLEQAASTGACVVTVNLLPRRNWGRPVGRDLDGRPVSRVLGACALYARFGPPGARVARWAAQGLSGYWWTPLTVQLQEAQRRVRRYAIPREMEWVRTPWYGAVRWVEVGCLRGEAASCLRAAGLTRDVDTPYPYYYNPRAALQRAQFLAYLLATGTPGQFAAFWHSPQPAAEAVGSSFGQPAGKLAMAAYAHWYSAPEEDERWGNAGGLAAGLVWVVLALALSVVAGRRWTIDS
jgi:hypothetical protein